MFMSEYQELKILRHQNSQKAFMYIKKNSPFLYHNNNLSTELQSESFFKI